MKPFRRTLVVKLMGRQPSYGFMVKKLRQIWERKGNIDIFDLDNDFYLVSFQHNEDYMEALIGGPWVINDAYLSVARWRPDFNPKNARIESVVAWVRIPELPAPLFDKKFLLNLGNSIGKAIRLDIHTAQRTRGKFARMCVELDLTKPLVPAFNVDGQILSVVYESMGLLCTKCGWYGHNKDGCDNFHRKKLEDMVVEAKGVQMKDGSEREGETEIWKTVQRQRRQRNNVLPNQEQNAGSRFSVLQSVVGEDEERPKVANMKENDRATVSSGKGLRDGVRNKQEKNGNNGSMGEDNKGAVFARNTNGGRATQEKMGVKEGGMKKVAVIRNSGSMRQNSGASSRTYSNCEMVPESNLEAYRVDKVNMEEKENLHPGERMEGIDMSPTGQRSANVGGEMLKNVESRMVEGGAASKGTANVLRDFKRRYKVDLVVVMETRISGNHAAKVVKKWGFKHSSEYGRQGDVFTAIYANPCEQRRHRTWEVLHSLASDVAEPWLMAGDFNEIKTPLEQKGGGRINETRCRKFNEWIQNCNLIDVEANGPYFTWRGPKWEGLDRVYKRLDRCLCNVHWLENFANAEIRVIPRVGSDHHPMLVNLNVENNGCRNRVFRYQVAWQMHDNFQVVMWDSWKGEEAVHVKLLNLQRDLTCWNKDVFGRIENRKRRILNRLSGIQQNGE
ncbi:hypothetical protein K1719_033767 [Acacia pycnantha]|nr:hypothetical protein K1719_033767 [Acacia pycnantha]